MEIQLKGIGKRFHGQWLFRNLEVTIPSLSSCAINGNNGSGKSTLIQIIYNYVSPSKGSIIRSLNQHSLSEETLIKEMAFVAPYLELPEELTLREAIQFHFRMRVPLSSDFDAVIVSCGLAGNENKQIRYFSSGMKQRLKLALAFNTECSLLLLDEPCSNLDQQGINWYCDMIAKLNGKRTILVASNQEVEYSFCQQRILIA